jgi:exodeoxyribonuclease VII small subunit
MMVSLHALITRIRMSEKPESYEAAVARLETIIARLDSGEAELRETLQLCVEAKELIEFCKGELDVVSDELRELKLDDLVAELETPPAEPRDG